MHNFLLDDTKILLLADKTTALFALSHELTTLRDLLCHNSLTTSGFNTANGTELQLIIRKPMKYSKSESDLLKYLYQTKHT